MLSMHVLTPSIQVNEVDVLAMRGSMPKRVQGKVVNQTITKIDFNGKKIGGQGIADAIAVMLPWSAPTLTVLCFRYRPYIIIIIIIIII